MCGSEWIEPELFSSSLTRGFLSKLVHLGFMGGKIDKVGSVPNPPQRRGNRINLDKDGFLPSSGLSFKALAFRQTHRESEKEPPQFDDGKVREKGDLLPSFFLQEVQHRILNG